MFKWNSLLLKVRKRAKIRNRYNQAPHTDQGYQWKSDDVTIRHHNQEPRGQPFPSMITRHQQTDVHEIITKQDRNDPKEGLTSI